MQIAIYTFLPIVFHKDYCNNYDKQNLWKPTSTSRCYFVSQLCGIKGNDSERKVQGKTKVYAKDDKKDDFSKNNGHYYLYSFFKSRHCTPYVGNKFSSLYNVSNRLMYWHLHQIYSATLVQTLKHPNFFVRSKMLVLLPVVLQYDHFKTCQYSK